MSGGLMDGGWWEALENTIVFKVLIISLYLGSNISLNMLNKWTLAMYGFKFPLVMSMSHMAFSFVFLGPIMFLPKFRDLHVATLKRQWVGIIAISGFFASNVGFNNISLMTVPLSLNQVVRAGIPVVAAIGAVFIERKTPSSDEFISLVILVSGVGIAVWEGNDQAASALGIILCVLGTISNGLMMSCIGRLMSEKLDALRLTFYTAPVTCAMLIPFAYALEYKQLVQYQATHNRDYVFLLLLGCVNAVVYNLVHVVIIKITSAVTTTVIGEMKIVMILGLSAFMLGEAGIWTVKMVVGCTTAILGFCMYSHVKLKQSQSAAAAQHKSTPETAPLLPPKEKASQV